MELPRRFRDRADAGRVVGALVAELIDGDDAPVVLGLPRGGVPVAAAVAEATNGVLDVLTVRKIGTPHHAELAIGAVASGGLVVRNDDLIRQLGLGGRAVERRIAIARQQLAEQEARFGGGRHRPDLRARVVVVVDDGLATGATMRAAVGAIRTAAPAKIIAAVPVGAPDSCALVAALADVLVCPLQPAGFHAVGQWYENFSATTDAEVIRLLAATA